MRDGVITPNALKPAFRFAHDTPQPKQNANQNTRAAATHAHVYLLYPLVERLAPQWHGGCVGVP